jgi:2-octaprenyl-6-methoxyphenol hydroxylase
MSLPASDAFPGIAVVGAGPVGLALALYAVQGLPRAQVTLYDARPLALDVSRDPRTLALSLGSVQLLQRLGAFDVAAAQPILEVHVSQQPPTGAALARLVGAEAELRISAAEEGVPMLGAVLAHGRIVAPLQAAWIEAAAREPQRLRTRFEAPVRALKDVPGGVEVDAGIAEAHDLVVVAEGGVFAAEATRSALDTPRRGTWRHDYRQTAWIGQATLERDHAGTAYERFTRHGPAALLPLPADGGGDARAALVWCVPADDDPVRELDDVQRLAVLNTIFPSAVGRLVGLTPLKPFALGLNAQRSLVGHAGDSPPAGAPRRVVRIGNAAQMLHPVAGQGLNLGLRDAFELVRALAADADIDAALRRVEWRRAPDRLSMIAATDFLARSFTWLLPGAGAARGLGLAALQALRPVKSLLARQMMYGSR